MPIVSNPCKLLRIGLVILGLSCAFGVLRDASWLDGTDQILKLDGSRVRWQHSWVPFLSRVEVTTVRVYDFDNGRVLAEYRLKGYLQQVCVSPLGVVAEILFNSGSDNTRELRVVETETGVVLATRALDHALLGRPYSFTTDGSQLVCMRNPQNPGDSDGIVLLDPSTLEITDSFVVRIPAGVNARQSFVAGDYAFYNDTRQLIHFGHGKIKVIPTKGLEVDDTVESIGLDAMAIVQRMPAKRNLPESTPNEENSVIHEEKFGMSADASEIEESGRLFLINLLSGETQEFPESIEHAGALEIVGSKWIFWTSNNRLTILNRDMTAHLSIPSDPEHFSVFLDAPKRRIRSYGNSPTKLKTWDIESRVGLERDDLARDWKSQYWFSVGCVALWLAMWVSFELWNFRRLGFASAGLTMVVCNALAYSVVLGNDYYRTQDIAIKVSIGIGMTLSILAGAILSDCQSHWLDRVAICLCLLGLALLGPSARGIGYRLEIFFAILGATPIAGILMRTLRLESKANREDRANKLTLATLFSLQAAIGVLTLVAIHFHPYDPDPFSAAHCIVLLLSVAILGVLVVGILTRTGRSRLRFALLTIAFASMFTIVVGWLPSGWQTPMMSTIYVNFLHFGYVLTEPQLSWLVMGAILTVLAKATRTFEMKTN